MNQTRVEGSCPSIRVKEPSTDWLPAYATPPTRPGSHSTAVQYDAESRGSATNPISTVMANEASAVEAARRRPARRRKATKSSGVSLMPAARPTSQPAYRRSTRSRS